MSRHPVQGGMEGQFFELSHAAETGIRSCSVALSFSFAKLLYLGRGNFTFDLSTGDPKMRGVIIINKA